MSKWLNRVVNDGGKKSAEILLYDEIDSMGWWGVSAKDFASELARLDATEIKLRINSPGGDVTDAVAIMNALRSHPATVTAVVEGMAASAASFIAIGGSDHVVMAPHSELMIHDASAIARGNAEDFAKVADRLNQVSDNIASIYAERAGGTAEDWRSVMQAETWYSAQEAVDAGLADRVDEAAPVDDKVSNRFDLSIYNFAGRACAPTPVNVIPTASSVREEAPTKQEVAQVATLIESLCARFSLAADATEADVIAAVNTALETPKAPVLPDGVVAVDSALLAALQVSAQRGDEARASQEAAERVAIVDAAIKDGKVAPVMRDGWIKQLEANPAVKDVINGLPAVFPVGEALGHSQDKADTDLPTSGMGGFAAQFGLTEESFNG